MHSLGVGSFTNPTVQSNVRSVVIYMVLEVLRSSLPSVILSTSGAKAGKCSDRASQAFVDFWTQCQKELKTIILGVTLLTSGAKARKCSDRAS